MPSDDVWNDAEIIDTYTRRQDNRGRHPRAIVRPRLPGRSVDTGNGGGSRIPLPRCHDRDGLLQLRLAIGRPRRKAGTLPRHQGPPVGRTVDASPCITIMLPDED